MVRLFGQVRIWMAMVWVALPAALLFACGGAPPVGGNDGLGPASELLVRPTPANGAGTAQPDPDSLGPPTAEPASPPPLEGGMAFPSPIGWETADGGIGVLDAPPADDEVAQWTEAQLRNDLAGGGKATAAALELARRMTSAGQERWLDALAVLRTARARDPHSRDLRSAEASVLHGLAAWPEAAAIWLQLCLEAASARENVGPVMSASAEAAVWFSRAVRAAQLAAQRGAPEPMGELASAWTELRLAGIAMGPRPELSEGFAYRVGESLALVRGIAGEPGDRVAALERLARLAGTQPGGAEALARATMIALDDPSGVVRAMGYRELPVQPALLETLCRIGLSDSDPQVVASAALRARELNLPLAVDLWIEARGQAQAAALVEFLDELLLAHCGTPPLTVDEARRDQWLRDEALRQHRASAASAPQQPGEAPARTHQEKR